MERNEKALKLIEAKQLILKRRRELEWLVVRIPNEQLSTLDDTKTIKSPSITDCVDMVYVGVVEISNLSDSE